MKPNDPIDYELQFSVKDWCLMRTDQLVGVAVMPLRQVTFHLPYKPVQYI